jgi:uncharacterized membrane protein YoaK (UPF0700 family)
VTGLTTDEMAEKIIRSLKKNSAELANERRAKRTARVRQFVVMGFIFVVGVIAGALLVTVL